MTGPGPIGGECPYGGICPIATRDQVGCPNGDFNYAFHRMDPDLARRIRQQYPAEPAGPCMRHTDRRLPPPRDSQP
ncbi:MAG TPA: hypothetical protein VEW42_00845 [Candidatus Eisenbacteria bacterium]|nr:hypothetical protein [Candidatus Eisenbacteria bacterium]